MPLLLAIHALGTRAELLIDASETAALRAIGEAAIEELRVWHDRLSLFQPQSFLSFVNREASRRAVVLDEDLWSLFELCDSVHRATGGAFDPTVAGLMSTAGLHPGDADAPTGWASLVELAPASRSVRFARDGVRLDLGGVAKGFALDMASAVLHRFDVGSAMLHAGTSSVIAMGDLRRRLAIRTGGGLHRVELHDAALAVSAPRGRRNENASHIMNPIRRECAVRIDTAVVIGAGPLAGAEADAWATALAALGRRPNSMPARLRSAVHDGDDWIESSITVDAPSEAA